MHSRYLRHVTDVAGSLVRLVVVAASLPRCLSPAGLSRSALIGVFGRRGPNGPTGVITARTCGDLSRRKAFAGHWVVSEWTAPSKGGKGQYPQLT
jgi:hypothetical protein